MDNTNKTLTEIIKKSALQAKNKYDFYKLQEAGEHFLPLKWTEEEEEILFEYDVRRMQTCEDIRKEDKEVILNLLIQAGKFRKDICDYSFSMAPANVYYNTNGSICIKFRDIRMIQEDNKFLPQYKAFAAWALLGQYTYGDYLEGGEELFEKNSITKQFVEIQDSEIFIEYLEQLKSSYLQKQRKKKAYVSKSGNIFLKTASIVLLVTTVALGIYSGRQYFETVPYLTAVGAANDAYIENDSIALIDELKPVKAEELDIHQKYILAKAYLQSENLTSEQKNNISGKMTLKTNQKELDYWIYLGRTNVKQAENLAMQLSDDELLLYAYMKEKAQIESDTAIDGEEKDSRLKSIQSKIDALADKYDLEPEQEKKETDEPES